MLATTTGGPTFEVGGWIAWVIIAGAVIGALGVIYKAIWPVVHMAIRFEERWPVLEQIAVDFKGNGHGTLGEQVARIEQALTDTAADVTQIKADRAVQVPLFEENNRKLDILYDYAHTNVHTLGGVIQEMQSKNDATTALTARLGEAVAELKGTREDIRGAATTAASVVETARVAAAAVLAKADEQNPPTEGA